MSKASADGEAASCTVPPGPLRLRCPARRFFGAPFGRFGRDRRFLLFFDRLSCRRGLGRPGFLLVLSVEDGERGGDPDDSDEAEEDERRVAPRERPHPKPDQARVTAIAASTLPHM